jgi:hypothetical protein
MVMINVQVSIIPSKWRILVMKRDYLFGLLSLIFLNISTVAQNPLIKNIGMSDPHIRVFNDMLFLFSGHDNNPNDKTWVMRDWRVFFSTDLLNWQLETIISPCDNYMGCNSVDCWAGDVAGRNGKYYFYFSDQKRSVGVMIADSPGEKYTDALGHPLVAPMHDPTIFQEEDENKTSFIVYGDKAGGGYHIAKLNPDMISLAENPKPIKIIGEEWATAPKWMDKNYLFKNKDTYYLSWGRDYAVSKNIYGPYICFGAVGQGHNLNEFAHGSFFWWKGQFYHIWTYYLRNGFKYRECIISYCHISHDGKIVTDSRFLDEHFETGVGQYKASWPEIQAEWYTEKSEEITKTGSLENGFCLYNLNDGGWVKFANVDFGNRNHKQIFSATFKGTGAGNFEIRLDSISGELIGNATIREMNNSNGKQIVMCNLKKVAGDHDLFILFTAINSELLAWDKFRINDVTSGH